MPKNLITAHFALEDFACHDGTPYPTEWITDRLRPLCELDETIREEVSRRLVSVGNPARLDGYPLNVDSGFRTLAYDQALYDKSAKDGLVAPASTSMHPKGMANDIRSTFMHATDLFNTILDLYRAGAVPRLGGLGVYPNFVHVDIRPRPGSQGKANDGHLAIWGASRPKNVL